MNPDQDPVLVHDEGSVRIIRIYRPEVRNAIDAKTAKALRKAWRSFEKNPDLRVGILTGGEEVFSAGADLADLDALVADIGGEHGPLGFTRHTLSKPTIAAIAGHCVAGGLEWACWCDLRIADTTAVFGFYERRFGVPLVDGGTQRLPRIIGLGRALDLILTGRPVSPEEARSIGLVNEIVPPGQALRRSVELANEIAAFPQMCLRQDRRAVYDGLDLPLAEGLKLEARLGAEVVGSGEPAAGARSFRERKKRN